jgi:hypothetical protein
MPQPPRLTLALRRLVAVIAVATFVVGACGAGAGAPSTETTPSPTASPSTPPPSPSAAGSPSVNPATDARAALDAFRAFIETEQSFHLTADMKLTIAGTLVDMDVAEDVSGGDEQGTIDVRGPRVSVHMEVVIVGGKAYLKIANRKWQQVDVDTSSSNPLGDLQVEGLEPIDIVNVGGVPAHHFRVEDPAALDPDTITGNALTGLKLSSASFDLYINDDGVPLTAILAFSGTGTFQGKTSPIEATIRYDFSRFGVPVKIVAPM